ncbi:30S ribosomal protein S2 [Candidatus Uhrbacteria bacterium]|nr:30S ribosomal protein S2 [Candidatus Uhrbacteria bacterium]
MQLPSLVDMLKSGVHFGHKKSKRHPKMAPYIFTTRGEISIINLEKTEKYLKEALLYLENIASKGGTVLFVGTKKQGSELVKKYAIECGMPYVNQRWLGGTLTNFVIIGKMIKKFKKLNERAESGELAKYTKKEQLDISREIEELDTLIGGIQNMAKIPDAIFILDLKKEKTPLREALKKKIPLVALCDTNTNPEEIDYPIPANDDAVKSIDMIVSLISAAIKSGKTKRAQEAEFAEKAKISEVTSAE